MEAAIRGAGLPCNQPVHMDDTAMLDAALPALHAEISGNRRPDSIIMENLVEK